MKPDDPPDPPAADFAGPLISPPPAIPLTPMAKPAKDLGFTALRVVGGLLPPEFLQAVSRLKAKGQTPADYGLTRSLVLKDKIGRYWRMAGDLWADYQERRPRQDLDARQVTVTDWLARLFEDVLGYHDLTPSGPVSFGDESRRPPHSLVQEYLNAAEPCLWGLVANGRQVRLLRDNPSLTPPRILRWRLPGGRARSCPPGGGDTRRSVSAPHRR